MGNRVKGRVKKKSIKAALNSSAGSKRKLSRMGKKRKADHSGLDASFIGRSQVLKDLQITLKDFRRLCILKGVYPREPRGRAPKDKKGQVFYHIKDVRAIAHEPILHKFREFRAFMKKVRRAAGRNEKDEAARKNALAPSYTLHHLVRERYPRFSDALADMDDALTLVFLFAALPSSGRIKSKVTNKAKSLAAAWGAYCATTSCITKSFISVKGIYLEANVQGSSVVRWVVPHAFTQHLPRDVDYRVMLTFFEFYETLLSFVLFKLYNTLGVRYPLVNADVGGEISGTTSTLLGANLKALTCAARTGSVGTAVTEAVQQEVESTKLNTSTKTAGGGKSLDKKNRELIKTVGAALNKLANEVDSDDDNDNMDDSDDEDGVDVAAPLKAALDSMAEEEGRLAVPGSSTGGAVLDEEATKRRRLFAGLTFYLSREVPRGYLELVALSFGAKVGWEGPDSPIASTDPSITHHLVDRPILPSSFDKLPQNREYVQPQWLLDCANFLFLLPCSKYGIGKALPPHLSPWVDDEEEGYKPAYAEEIEKLKNGEIVADEDGENNKDSENDDNDDDGDDDESVDEAAMTKFAETKALAAPSDESKGESENEEDDEEEDEQKEKERKDKRRRQEEEESHKLAKVMMNKKAARLYGRMQHGLAQKKAKVDNLHKRRRELELQDGKSVELQKVERMRKERRELEKKYSNTGGSMKKTKTS